MKLEICNARTKAVIHTLDDISVFATIQEIKEAFQKVKPNYYISRQSLRSDPRGKSLPSETSLKSLGFEDNGCLYFKDLGPQIGWKTVFLCEYAGPFVVYMLFYLHPSFIYGPRAALARHVYVDIACGCWLFHYGKRLLETAFIHRFSNATMPLGNLFKNCTYYWGFTSLVAYFVNHPLYTPASFGNLQVYPALIAFALCEYGNFACHLLFRNLRPAGTTVRKIPVPNGDPFTHLFHFVSCPNYTYEAGSWIAFTVLSQTLTAGLFTVCGIFQMAIWAVKKHKNYRREFKDYPKGRKVIVPFLF